MTKPDLDCEFYYELLGEEGAAEEALQEARRRRMAYEAGTLAEPPQTAAVPPSEAVLDPFQGPTSPIHGGKLTKEMVERGDLDIDWSTVP